MVREHCCCGGPTVDVCECSALYHYHWGPNIEVWNRLLFVSSGCNSAHGMCMILLLEFLSLF